MRAKKIVHTLIHSFDTFLQALHEFGFIKTNFFVCVCLKNLQFVRGSLNNVIKRIFHSRLWHNRPWWPSGLICHVSNSSRHRWVNLPWSAAQGEIVAAQAVAVAKGEDTHKKGKMTE